MLNYVSMIVSACMVTLQAYRIAVFSLLKYIALYARAKEKNEPIRKVGPLVLGGAIGTSAYRKGLKLFKKTNDVYQR